MSDKESEGLKNIVGEPPPRLVDPCPSCGRPIKEHTIEWYDGARYTYCPGAVRFHG